MKYKIHHFRTSLDFLDGERGRGLKQQGDVPRVGKKSAIFNGKSSFSGAILHSFCIVNRKFKTTMALYVYCIIIICVLQSAVPGDVWAGHGRAGRGGVPRIAKEMVIVQYKIIVFQGRFTILSAFSIENFETRWHYIAIRYWVSEPARQKSPIQSHDRRKTGAKQAQNRHKTGTKHSQNRHKTQSKHSLK